MTTEAVPHEARAAPSGRVRPSARVMAPAALALFTAIACLLIIGTVLQAREPEGFPGVFPASLSWTVALLAYPATGALVVVREPRNAVGWILIGIGLAFGCGVTLDGISTLIDETGSAADRAAVLYMFSGAAFQTGFVLIAMLLLTFPTGGFAARAWRAVAAVLWLLLGVSMLGLFTRVGPVAGSHGPTNPWAMPAVAAIVGPIAGGPGFLVFGLLLVASAVSVFLRFRHADSALRAQLLWFTLGAATLAVLFGVDAVLQVAVPQMDLVLSAVGTILEGLAFGALAASVAIAMLRHGLFDVDRVAVRSLSYGALVIVATAGYVAIVTVAGAPLNTIGVSGALAPFVAAAVVAIVFHPLRIGLLRLCERLVLGQRSTPYQVLASMSRSVAGTLSTEHTLPAMARAVAGATGGVARVWLQSTGDPVLAATWPMPMAHDDATAQDEVTPQGGATSAHDQTPQGELFEVSHGGEILGVLAVQRSTALTRAERRLVGDLASQAGIVLRNAALSAQLQRRLGELRSTAARLTSSAEAERRRLERDLHDGAQQQLTAITLKIGVARAAAAEGPPQLQTMLAELAADNAAALASIRELSRGLFPPLLTTGGLRTALTARSRAVPVPVTVHCPDGRFAPAVEGAAYFCCAEALQNATKHAQASHVRIDIEARDAHLHVRVRDDGAGFDVPAALADGEGIGLHNMIDRFTALGGALAIESEPGSGTTITGTLPLTEPAGALP